MSRRKQLLGHVVTEEDNINGQNILRGVSIWGLTFFHRYPRNHAKMLLIASFAFVVMLGGGVGVAIGAHFLSEVLGMTVPPEVISRASHMAFLSVLGLSVTIIGVLVHASGLTEEGQGPRRPAV